MSGMIGYALGYDAGRSDEQTANHHREVVHQIFYGARPVTVDQSYIDRLHAALAEARATRLIITTPHQFHAEALEWKDKGPAVQKRGAVLEGREVRPRKG